MNPMNPFINLLPFSYRRKVLLRRRCQQWALVWLACSVVLAALAAMRRAQYVHARQVMERAERAYAPVAQWTQENQAMQAELDTLHARGTLLAQLSDRRPPLALLGVASRSANRCGGRLFVRSMTFRRNPRHFDPASQKKEGKEKGQPSQDPGPWAFVTFQGEAMDNVAVATFVVTLREQGPFRRVELKASTGTETPSSTTRSYTVDCEI